MDFTPVKYNLRTSNGDTITEERVEDGQVQFKVIGKDGKPFIKNSNEITYSSMYNEEVSISPDSINSRIYKLEQRITQLESLLNKDVGKDKIT